MLCSVCRVKAGEVIKKIQVSLNSLPFPVSDMINCAVLLNGSVSVEKCRVVQCYAG